VPALALSPPLAAMIERLQSRATADAMSAPDLIAAAARRDAAPPALGPRGARSLRPCSASRHRDLQRVQRPLAVEWATRPGLAGDGEAVATRDAFP
jgi:hypothetical protein